MSEQNGNITFETSKFTPKSPLLTSINGNSPELQAQHPNKVVFHEQEEATLPDPKDQRFDATNEDYNAVPTYPLRQSYKDFHSQLRAASRVVVFDGSPDDPYRPASVPIYQTATFEQPCATEYGAYDYTRSGNPTRTSLERQVAMLENAHAAFAFSSGLVRSLVCIVDFSRASFFGDFGSSEPFKLGFETDFGGGRMDKTEEPAIVNACCKSSNRSLESSIPTESRIRSSGRVRSCTGILA